MAKRTAGSQLTQDNWNDDDETEDPGVFKQASDDVMKERKIIKPKRKLGSGMSSGETSSAGAFKGFSGFGAAKSGVTPAAGLFDFKTDTSKPSLGVANGSGSKPSAGFRLPPIQSNHTENDKTDETKNVAENSVANSQSTSNGVGKSSSASQSKYLHRLECLNQSVAKWIKQHVDKNPHCILTPIFKDYEKYLAEIEKLNPDVAKDGKKEPDSTKANSNSDTIKSSEPPKPAETSSFSFVAATTGASGSSTTTSAGASLFSFGSTKNPPSSSTSASSTGTSIFGGSAVESGAGATGFSFGAGSTSLGVKPFSFSTGGTSASSIGGSEDAGTTEEEYVPPKVEVSQVKEDDALYTKRCKMYYNKDGTWVEKGVGNLHLKPCNGKTQLLIRADTNLGNILLNVMLSIQMPFARQGKNNVQFMCIPHPALDAKDSGEPKETSILLRVKTGEDADELLHNIEKHK